MASGRLNGCSSCGGSAFVGLDTGESRAEVAEPGLFGFFTFLTAFVDKHMSINHRLIKLRFYVPLDTKQVISDILFPANLLTSPEKTKLRTT